MPQAAIIVIIQIVLKSFPVSSAVFSSLPPACSAPSCGSAFNLYRLISITASGPPVRLPRIMPTVAAETPISVAPTAPIPSYTGPNADVVPTPPARAPVPIWIPSRGCRPSIWARNIPSRPCNNTRRSTDRAIPAQNFFPRSSRVLLKPKPTQVKNRFIRWLPSVEVH